LSRCSSSFLSFHNEPASVVKSGWLQIFRNMIKPGKTYKMKWHITRRTVFYTQDNFSANRNGPESLFQTWVSWLKYFNHGLQPRYWTTDLSHDTETWRLVSCSYTAVRRYEFQNFIFELWKQYFTYERDEWIKKVILPWEDKIHIFKLPCNVLKTS
jgi:hypothetical protein